MKVSRIVIIFGVVVLLAGTIFYFQGQGHVGPESSFMYSNPEWVTYGLEIAVTGIVILGIGISLAISKKF